MKTHPISYMKKHWHKADGISSLIALSLSLTFFVRLLNFFNTPHLNKIIVYPSLFIFFCILTIIFISPIVEHLLSHKKLLYSLSLSAALIISLLFVVIPYKNPTFPTVHQLSVSVHSDSGLVVLDRFTGSDGKQIPLEVIIPGQDITDDAIYIEPGDSFEFSRKITDSVNFRVTALNADAKVNVRWDDQLKSIQLKAEESYTIQTDPTSWGQPLTIMRYFMVGVIVNEWISYVLLCIIAIGFITMKCTKPDDDYIIHMPELKRYLMDYIILNTILIILASIENFFPINHTVHNIYFLMPGLFLLFVKMYFRRLLPLLILLGGILVNLNFHINTPDYNLLHAKHLKSGSFNDFVMLAHPNQPTMLSIGFYEQLRETELVMAPDSLLAEKTNLDRITKLNNLKKVYIYDYQDQLTAAQFNELIALPDWEVWEDANFSYYFYAPEGSIDSPIAIYYHGGNILLIPIHYTQVLGLPHDFILN